VSRWPRLIATVNRKNEPKLKLSEPQFDTTRNTVSKNANCNFCLAVDKVSPMNNLLIIRPATENDAEAIASLIQTVAHYCLSDQPGEGTKGFLASLSQTAVSGYIRNPDFCYIVGLLDDKLAGIAALRNNKHVYHLFVSPAHHRRGAATQLWQHLKSHAIASGNTAGFTVNSSLFAVPVYAHWGFVPTATPQVKNGISFQAMHLPN
jgi:GNAT superfamily N-acetyltransferase